ncbi:hypothetical protein HPB50_015715 [Hyalomma asiaticum]|uniref:Uncharacterized protein n=1 Tax=Hyalomma asiaticum TaxID=266040 RepID=A0ACB7SW23_HYAAI|nr:hypothetical protein HPB50_015715 [Hyalomma asiaticum]
MDLTTILEKTVSPDKNELEAAQRYLEQAAQTNLILSALGTETIRPSSAAQCVAYVAVAELPQMQWPDLIQVLTNNATNPASTEMLREATLEAIGYICQDIEPEVLLGQSNDILTAIVHGMRKDEPSEHVKLAATTALLNSLEFTRANFEKDSERHFIMQVVCEATQSSNTQVRVAALQCLVKIMSLYYQYMEHYMGPALFAITMEAMKSDIDEVALQGIEFWSNVCEEEVDLSIEASEASEQGRPPARTSRFYAKGALQYLVPILVQTLTKQEEHDDEDDWNPCKAAGVCLMLMASCCEDDMISHSLPFVRENIKHPDWRYRDAAVMTFGCLLEGPDPAILKPLVEQAMPTLIELMCDQSVVVRDTVAWTIGRVCEIIPEAVVAENYLGPLLQALVKGLGAEPRVAANVCWAFNSLAEAAFEAADTPGDGSEPETYCLSEYFEVIVSKLLETTESTVLALEGHIQSSSDRAQYNDLQSLLCATLQSVLRKMTLEDAPKISDAVVAALLQMFSSSSGRAGGGVQEDALMAASTLVEGTSHMAPVPSSFTALHSSIFSVLASLEPIVCVSRKRAEVVVL